MHYITLIISELLLKGYIRVNLHLNNIAFNISMFQKEELINSFTNYSVHKLLRSLTSLYTTSLFFGGADFLLVLFNLTYPFFQCRISILYFFWIDNYLNLVWNLIVKCNFYSGNWIDFYWPKILFDQNCNLSKVK